MHKIDDIDRTIFSLLSKDGRMSAADIARVIGNVTDRTVSYRINQLIESGVMKIVPFMNPEALGYTITADLSIQTEPKKLIQVAKAVAKLQPVVYVAIVAGDRDITATVHVAGVRELQSFITETLLNIPGVQRTRSQILTQVVKDIDKWAIPDDAPALK
jgi:DNA-binding Lrp family transcriptional regulator